MNHAKKAEDLILSDSSFLGFRDVANKREMEQGEKDSRISVVNCVVSRDWRGGRRRQRQKSNVHSKG